MRNRRSLRPAVESLDTLRLLSTVVPTGTGHHVAPAQIHAERIAATTATPVSVVALHGTFHATGTLTNVSDDAVTLTGSGNLGQVGVATLHSKFSTHSTGPSVLTTKLGKIYLTTGDPMVQSSAGGISSSNTYTVTGGTGVYAQATGSGTFAFTIPASTIRNYINGHGNKLSVNIAFS